MSAATLNALLLGADARYGARAMLRHKVGGVWHDMSVSQFLDRVGAIHAALRAAGLAPGTRVGILSENRPEWAIADAACLTARLVDVPVYPTLTGEQTATILRDAGVALLFVSSASQLAKIAEVRTSLPELREVVVFDPIPAAAGVSTLAAFEARGAEAAAQYADWKTFALAAEPDDLATLIYTSGTTGEPKGVMLSHGNIAGNVAAGLGAFRLSASDSCLSFLPLCHIFERMAGYYCMIAAGAVISYATSIESVAEELVEVRPTVLMSVPRLYEKIYARVHDTAHRNAIAWKIFTWAARLAERRADAIIAHHPMRFPAGLEYPVADALVFHKLRARTGGRIRFCISGGAPLDAAICRFFLGAGIPLLEGYGLTETSPVIAVNTFEHFKPGTVGRPLAGIDVRIAGDGEILVRGSGVMQGYLHHPEATAAAIDADHWFHTGDIGEIDADGFLKITDRKKDLIKTSGGKYVAPQPIESKLRLNHFIANAVVLGDRRKFPIAVLVPNFQHLATWAAEHQIAERDPESLARNAAVGEKLEREARKSLRDLAHFEMPKKFLILPRDFSLEAGELTPSLKVKRRVVEEHYHDQIEALYTGL